MKAKDARGYFQYLLAMDCETSGMFFNHDDPSIDPTTGKTFQSVSWGLVVADAITLQPIEKLYLEIKWNGESEWSERAQAIHGLTLEHLERHGLTEEEAVIEIGQLLLKYWGPDGNIRCLGHNVATFDLWFLKRLMRKFEIELKFGSRHIDTSSIAFGTIGAYNSDDLFSTLGFGERDPAKHNALDDALLALRSVKVIRTLWKETVGVNAYE